MLFLLTDAISTTAQAAPERQAVVCRNEHLNYGQLEQRSNQLARTLIDQGVQRGSRVGIYLEKSLETAIALYGVMKAGAAYVPLDPVAPTSRLDRIVRHSGIRHLVTAPNRRRGLVQLLSQIDSPIESLIGAPTIEGLASRQVSWREIGLTESTAPNVPVIDQDLAYIMYQGESPNDLQGIMHTHASGLSFAKWAHDVYDLRSEDRLTNHSPLHSNLSTFDFFASALAGATTIIVGDEHLNIPSSYTQLMDEAKITTIFSLPHTLTQLLKRGALDQRDLSALRWIIFSGERFPQKHLFGLMNTLPHTRFSHLYGPAEVNGCTFHHIPRSTQARGTAIHLGKVWRNADALIVDAHDQVVLTDHTPGELLIRSSSMMQGYWNKPDLNKRAFAQLAGTEEHPHYYYCTGDRVERLPDGNLNFLGHKDRQIRVQNCLVDLDEVEAALLTLSPVEEAATFAISDGNGSHAIHAAVVLSLEESATSATALIANLKERLPDYAIPKKLTTEMTFPRTTSGKIDRRGLANRAV